MSQASSPHKSTATPRTPASPLSATKSSGTGTFPMALQLAQTFVRGDELRRMRDRLRGQWTKSKEQSTELQASVLLYAMANELRFPVRTAATAMILYHRFHLTYPIADFPYTDVCAACLFVACKMEDTPKKIRDIMVSGFVVRHPGRDVPDASSTAFDEQRRRVIGLERMVLECMSFDFRQSHAFVYVIKFTRELKWSMDESHMAWMTAVDAYRTMASLKVGAQAIACACILLVGMVTERGLVDVSPFYRTFDHVLEALDDLFDLYIHNRQFSFLGTHARNKDFINVRIDLYKALQRTDEALHRDANLALPGSEMKALHVTKLGERGTVRFFLDYDIDRRADEIRRLEKMGVDLEAVD